MLEEVEGVYLDLLLLLLIVSRGRCGLGKTWSYDLMYR